jgi:hypothetical protein
LIDTLTKIRTAEPVRPRKYQPAIPELFEGVVLQLLAKRPEDRYQNAGQLPKALGGLAQWQEITL